MNTLLLIIVFVMTMKSLAFKSFPPIDWGGRFHYKTSLVNVFINVCMWIMLKTLWRYDLIRRFLIEVFNTLPVLFLLINQLDHNPFSATAQTMPTERNEKLSSFEGIVKDKLTNQDPIIDFLTQFQLLTKQDQDELIKGHQYLDTVSFAC